MKAIFLFFFIFINPSFAQYKGSISFTAQEISQHKKMAKTMVENSRSCLLRHKKEHIDFYKKTCIKNWRGNEKCLSKFYGERRYSKKEGQRRSDGQKLEYLPKELQKEGFNPELVNYMEATSCVGLALQCLKEGFQATGQSSQWQTIMSYVRLNNVGGTALQDALQKIGWSIYYWNPSATSKIEENAARWDAEEKNWQSKGWHLYRYQRVMSRGTYWYNSVDNAYDMVGFQDQVPQILYSYPYWVGTANTGYHVFPGTYEKVVEAHSTRHFTAFDNLEFSDFNPFATGGGPRWTKSEKYRSGLVALPPIF
ncbi:MAG: hypothetical protein K9K67_01120 [Bacteriovoracaceae bacterium]|nr:hypothetical protein [Bacteriovoracaceae bacterium]